MSDNTPPPFDPRFSPAFQRGFDPAAATQTESPSAAERSGVTAPSSVLTGNAPLRAPASPPSALTVQPPAFAPAAPTAPTAPSAGAVQQAQPGTGLSADPSAVADSAEVTVTSGDFEPVDTPRRNPFLVVLAVVAVVLVGLGVWLFMRSGAAFNSTEIKSQGDYMTLTATIETAPFIALLGVATAIGVLFVFASRWGRRR